MASLNAVFEARLAAALKQAKLDAHPVGSYYWSSESTSPADLFGGTWVQVTDKFVYAAGSKSVGTTGGEETHKLTIAETPAHGHTVTIWTSSSDGANGTGNSVRVSGTTVTTNSSGASYRAVHSWQSAAFKSYGGYTPDGGSYIAGYGDPSGNTYYVGGSGSHNNMPPYITAYCWRRTA